MLRLNDLEGVGDFEGLLRCLLLASIVDFVPLEYFACGFGRRVTVAWCSSVGELLAPVEGYCRFSLW